MSAAHDLLTNPDIWIQIIGPGGLLLTLVGGAVKIFRGQRRRVQAQAEDGDALEVSDGIVARRLGALERQVRALVEHVLRLDAYSREHPCTHIPPHPMPQLPMDVLLGVHQTPPGGMPAIPTPRLEK